MQWMRRSFLLFLSVCLLAFSGCGFLYQPEESASPSAVSSGPPAVKKSPGPTAAPTPTPKPDNINLLTGLPTLSQEAVGRRPVAVMVNNIFEALPQYGVSEADLIFELPVEYGITRLMAVYGDDTKVPEVCSVRSCRYYFPILAAGYDAYYVHWGQDETIATEVLNTLALDRMDGMADTYGLFFRDEERAAEGFAYEHTGVFNGPALPEALQKNGVRTELPVDKNEPFFDFNSVAQKPEGRECKNITAAFSEDYYSTFSYNEKSHLYYKEHSGKDHRDRRTGKQLSFTNVFLLETEISVRDEAGRLDLNWQGGRDHKGYYVSEGGVCPVTWEKADEYSNLVFSTEDGARLRVNPGRSYLGFLSPGSVKFDG